MNKLISEEIKYDGPRFNVIQKQYQREDGLVFKRDCVEPGDAVVIIPVNENNEVVFIEQYRETIESVALELPAGMIEKGEDPREAAIRELEEETGIKARQVEFLTSVYASAGYTAEKLYVYYAKDFEYGTQHLDETEEILNIRKIPLEECIKLIIDNKIDHASVVIAAMTYYYKCYNGGKK